MNHPSVRSLILGTLAAAFLAQSAEPLSSPDWLSKPLALEDCIDLALRQNSAIRKSESDLEAAHGVILQTRSIAIPKIRATGNFTGSDPASLDKFPPQIPIQQADQHWTAGIQVVQSIYEGGRVRSALRSAKLTREQALAQHQVVLTGTLLEVRLAYYDVLLAAQQIVVQEASVNLLQKELDDQQRRFDAGTVPKFNVLRAEVELANAKPRLIRARNALRISQNNLAHLLGFTLPREVWGNIPMKLSGTLESPAWTLDLPAAIAQSMERRPELEALRNGESLRREGIQNARAGRLPSVQLFAGWGWRNSNFSDDLKDDLSGWSAGAQMTWDIFDGFNTRGRVQEATAHLSRAEEELSEAGRRIELEVRTAYSNVMEAREVLESTRKVHEQAEEALRLAMARSEAGTGTQLDVLNAQTALTEARTIQIQAQRDFAAARARLERAIGADLRVTRNP
jgi:outer membrane protein TolC